MGRNKPTSREDDNVVSQGGSKSKSKKKAHVIDDDEYSIGTELSTEQESVTEKTEEKVTKKGKKGKSKDVDDEEKDLDENGADAPAIAIAGKKKPKGKRGGNDSFNAFDLLNEGEKDDEPSTHTVDDEDDVENEDEDVPVVSFTGKKKSSTSSKKGGSSLFSASAFDAIGDDGGEVEQEEVDDDKSDNGDAPVIAFLGKKKSSKSKKKSNVSFGGSSFAGLDDEDETRDESKDDDEDAVPITFTGKKKSSKSSKKSNSFSAAFVDEENGEDDVDEDVPAIAFSGKKKSSKKKNNSVSPPSDFDVGLGEEVIDAVEPERNSKTEVDEQNTQPNEVAETSKNKKKKKKGGRTVQEEEDLDKILAELGEAPPVSQPALPPPGEKVEVQLETVGQVDVEGAKEGEEGMESAAAKKKKKKKEKEKEKKAAAAATAAEVNQEQQETKSKVSDKKVPKHVREMREALARRKEAEERKKREEEERIRKEEEERRRQEEQERQAEEARRRKKEREKEKLLKKKQEGRLLTGKQKEEARRLEAMRNQILANAGGLPLPSDTSKAPTKRPKYQTKKSKPSTSQTNGADPIKSVENILEKETQSEALADIDSTEADKVEEEKSMTVEEKDEVSTAVQENGVEEEDDEDEWDAKSWDDADVALAVKSAFADEEADSEPETVVTKETKLALPGNHNAGVPVAAAKPVAAVKRQISSGSQDMHSKKEQLEAKGDTEKGVTQRSDPSSKENADTLRSPICCIMGHVDTGKTKLLDCIRGTNVQEGEAGGITQQIGATYFPAKNILARTSALLKDESKFKVPGLLVIDTPGHASFTNLRSRGSGLCDLAILVVDIMHSLEEQTIESINLLKMRKTEFIVALNKVDRLYGWKTCPNAPIQRALKQQTRDVQKEFNQRLEEVIFRFKEQGLNTELYYKNSDMGETFNIVPTSAISGEGIPDLLLLLVQRAQKTMLEKLTFSDEVQCTVLEVKVIEGHGTTIDVVLVNGVLHEGEEIVGPIVTTIRALLTPHPMKEIRVKGDYLHHKEIRAAQGIKISAQGLEHAIAGTSLYVVRPGDDLEDIKELAMQDMKSIMSKIEKSGEGVYVQASTLGSLEALLAFLKEDVVNIPVSGIGIGPVHKKDVMKASVMLEKKKEFATILAFDVKVTPEARELAEEYGVKIFIADIIYHLFDQFKAYIDTLKEEKKKEAAEDAVFPCVLKIIPNCVFNKKDPIVLGVDVLEGIVKVGTPICVPSNDFICIGKIASIENNHKPVDRAKKGDKVAIKIIGSSSEEQQRSFGRHFDIDDELVSQISRRSIDVLKANYRASDPCQYCSQNSKLDAGRALNGRVEAGCQTEKSLKNTLRNAALWK
ncbi:Translation initiation factor IF- 2, domain 3 [Dillenia turbinata]|uniref:Eukaryotic translation initiation factor 5B n=1 Tax=Dillenia turbinata TaxID=194707 RepID=A0AAN8UZ03_9MAGN